jgi:hypothetical protein
MRTAFGRDAVVVTSGFEKREIYRVCLKGSVNGTRKQTK